MRNQIKILLREGLLGEEQYFNTTIDQEIKERSNRYVGNNVIWYGNPDKMIVVHKNDVVGMDGNVYDYDKMDFIVNLIQNKDDRDEDRIELEASYAFGEVVTITNIVEEQNAMVQDRFETDYDGLDRPRSTGDEELDRYLGVEYLDEFDELAQYVEDGDLFSLFDKNKTHIALGHVSPEKLRGDFNSISDGSQEDYDAFNQFINYENMIKDAISNKSGDIGSFKVQLRDGHHRVMGAIKAGEEYICVDLGGDGIEQFKGYYTKVE